MYQNGLMDDQLNKFAHVHANYKTPGISEIFSFSCLVIHRNIWKPSWMVNFSTVVVYRVGILGQLFGTPLQLLEHHPILGQLFGTPQLLEHQPIEPWGLWDNCLEHHPNF